MIPMGKIYFALLLLFFCFQSTPLAEGSVASSDNYELHSDSINFGGNLSTSDDYRLEDTLGEAGSGLYSSTTMIFNGGYQAMPIDVYLAVSSPGNVAMVPSLDGVAGGTSNGSAIWQVQTDNPAGYEMSVRAATTPALKSGEESFADYSPSYDDPDFSWNTPDSESRFGFSPEGDHVIASYLDNGLSCNTGAGETSDACWNGFSASDQVIARYTSPVYPVGASTTVKFRAEVGAQKIQEQGSYQANITVTVVSL